MIKANIIARIVFTLFFFIGIQIVHSSIAAADSREGAYNFINDVSKKALQIIKSKEGNAQKENNLSKLFLESVDTKWIARFAMGRYWREASAKQREDYLARHKRFLLNSYVPKFKEYTNQEIKINKSYPYDKNKNEYIVETQIVSNDGATINVDYKVRKDEDGKYTIFDVVAEGVSLIVTQRSDFSSILARGGINDLIQKLNAKI